MAFRDYIICGECETKIIYDGYDNGRDRLEEVWGDPKTNFWTVHLLCPDCLKKLRAELDAARDALRHQRDALIIVRDRQGGCASVEDINQGIAQINAALKDAK